MLIRNGTIFVNDNIFYEERSYNYLKNNWLNMTNITFQGYGFWMEKYKNEREKRIEFKILRYE